MLLTPFGLDHNSAFHDFACLMSPNEGRNRNQVVSIAVVDGKVVKFVINYTVKISKHAATVVTYRARTLVSNTGMQLKEQKLKN